MTICRHMSCLQQILVSRGRGVDASQIRAARDSELAAPTTITLQGLLPRIENIGFCPIMFIKLSQELGNAA